MRKKGFYVWSLVAALMVTACSEKDDNIQSGETAEFKFEVNFEGTAQPQSRAAGSTAIPATSWSSIKQIQFFLYEGGTVKYSAIETVSPGASGTQTFTYADVPVSTPGGYTLVAVANANSSTDNIASYISTLTPPATTWNAYNVRSKAISDMYLGYKATTFPAYANPTGNTAFTAPAEVFMAEASGVVITSGGTATVPNLKLKREVSLMRVRLNVDDTDAGVNNTSTGVGGVDWTQNVSVLIYTLPDKMSVEAGNNGGVSNTSTDSNVIVANGAFGGTAAGYTNGNFTMWKDIVVFPNNGGRVNNVATAAAGNNVDATPAQKYFIVVTALGKAGHVLKNGTVLAADQTISWSGLISKAFFPNTIREVNLTLKSGGETEIPVTPIEQGTLTIDVSTPEPWDSNIQDVEIEL